MISDVKSPSLSDYDYHLPPDLIAQKPVEPRDSSRLLAFNLTTGQLAHKRFLEIPDFFRAGDVLVLNNSKVVPALVKMHRKTGGTVWALVCAQSGVREFNAMLKTSRHLRPGDALFLEGGERLELRGLEGYFWKCAGELEAHEMIVKYGRAPLPPYIKRTEGPDELDRKWYQTVYASIEGSVAAPTAGLHFTDRVLTGLKEKGINIVFITLHVGPGTFIPVKTERVADHKMLPERYEIDSSTVNELELALKEDRRIIAVGTTVCRTLEHYGRTKRMSGETSLFITEPFEFKVVKSLVTNFHIPKGTPLMLVSAFAGRDRIMDAYKIAIEMKYRFFSYGDSMFLYRD